MIEKEYKYKRELGEGKWDKILKRYGMTDAKEVQRTQAFIAAYEEFVEPLLELDDLDDAKAQSRDRKKLMKSLNNFFLSVLHNLAPDPIPLVRKKKGEEMSFESGILQNTPLLAKVYKAERWPEILNRCLRVTPSLNIVQQSTHLRIILMKYMEYSKMSPHYQKTQFLSEVMCAALLQYITSRSVCPFNLLVGQHPSPHLLVTAKSLHGKHKIAKSEGKDDGGGGLPEVQGDIAGKAEFMYYLARWDSMRLSPLLVMNEIRDLLARLSGLPETSVMEGSLVLVPIAQLSLELKRYVDVFKRKEEQKGYIFGRLLKSVSKEIVEVSDHFLETGGFEYLVPSGHVLCFCSSLSSFLIGV